MDPTLRRFLRPGRLWGARSILYAFDRQRAAVGLPAVSDNLDTAYDPGALATIAR
jgi:hypothetical protein